LVNDWKKQDGGWWTSTRSRTGHVTGKLLMKPYLLVKKTTKQRWISSLHL